jgi:hypothetical protein
LGFTKTVRLHRDQFVPHRWLDSEQLWGLLNGLIRRTGLYGSDVLKLLADKIYAPAGHHCAPASLSCSQISSKALNVRAE